MTLERFIRRLHLSARAAAKKIDISQSGFTHLLAGTSPSVKLAGRIVAASGGRISYEDLMSREDRAWMRRHAGCWVDGDKVK